MQPAQKKAPVQKEPQFEESGLIGRWQEEERREVEKRDKLPFTDTLYLHFFEDNKVLVREGKAMNMRGAYFIEGAYLIYAGIEQRIIELTKDKLVLSDGEQERRLKPVAMFVFEGYGTKQIEEKKGAANNNFTGVWNVYRTESTPGTNTDLMLIRKLEIGEKLEEGKWQGKLTENKSGQLHTEDVLVRREGEKMYIVKDGNETEFNIDRFESKALIIERNAVRYYFKKQN
jgi:hypothetical protein